jgi:hypothetical protein
VKDKTVNQIVDELDELFEITGLSAVEIMQALLEVPVPNKYRKFVRMGYKAGWKSLLRPKPEPSKAQVDETIAIIRAFKSAPHKMKALIKQKMKEMPHAPGGPPRKIKPEEEKTVCSEVLALRAEVDTREAIRRVAAKRGVSDRTIYRIWGKRYPKKKRASTQ